MIGSNHLGMISERLGDLGVFLIHGIFRSPKSQKKQPAQKQHTKTSGWLWEDHESANVMIFIKENYQHHCHPLSISSFVTCIISSHMGAPPQDGGVPGGNPGNPLKGHGKIGSNLEWQYITCLHHAYMGVSVNGGTPKTPQNDHF